MVTLVCVHGGHSDCGGCNCICHAERHEPLAPVQSVNESPPGAEEMRCGECDKLLAEKAATGTVIICSRCKTRNEVESGFQTDDDLQYWKREAQDVTD